MPAELVTRMRGYGTTVFSAMTALAERTGAVNLGQGFPDTDGPPEMLALAAEAITSGGRNQYPPGPGLAELREAIAEQRARDHGHVLDPRTEVLVTLGATEGVSATMLALVEPGDEVVVLDPAYDSYAAAVALAGGVRRSVPLVRDGARFALDAEALRAAVGPRTRVLLVNSPHNPTGTVLGPHEVAAIAELARERDLVVVTDEVYEHLVFDGAEHRSLAALEGMRERTLAVSSAGKTFSVTGWKVGWVTGPEPLVRAVGAVKQFLTFTANAPLQLAVAHALRFERGWVAELRASLERRRDLLLEGLDVAGLPATRPEGTYFALADARALGADAREVALTLPYTHGVVAIPVAGFAEEPDPWLPWLRFTYCKRADVVADGVSRLRAGAREATAGRVG